MFWIWVFWGTAEAGRRRPADEAAQLVALAAREDWAEVERAYVEVDAPSHDQHLLGARAAEARGDVREAWERLRAAQALARRDSTGVWIATIEATHGLVVISAPRGILEGLDAPDDDRAVAFAAAELRERGAFTGLLPLGRYQVGGARFEVDGGPSQRITVTGEAEPPPAHDPALVHLVAVRDLPSRVATSVVPALRGIDGVTSARIVSPPPTITYVDYAPDQLDAVGLTATELAREVRQALGLADHAVVARPTTIAIRSGVVDRERLEGLVVGDGTIALAAIAAFRDAPDDRAPPAGIDLVLAPNGDPDLVRARATEVLAGSEAADWFAR